MSFAVTVPKTQAERIREHLEAGKSITPGQAMLVYGISRLAVSIDRLRLSGMDIDMVLKTDESGKGYGEYRLRQPIAIHDRVQVGRGHGWGLPKWVRKTRAAKVVGLVADIAYVEFIRGTHIQTVPVNTKELVRAA